MKASGISFVRLTLERISDLPLLFEQVFGRKVHVNFFLEKYDAVRLGNVFYGCCAYDGDRLVGYTGVRIREISWRGETQLSAEAVDGMVHPNYRGSGLFQSMIEECLGILSKEGIQSFWGIPNAGSGHVLLERMLWKRGVELRRYMVPVQSRLVGQFKRLVFRILRKKAVFSIFQTDELPAPSFGQDHMVVVRQDKNGSNGSGTCLLKLEGLRFWVRVNRAVLYLGDMDTPASLAHFKKGLAELKRVANRAGLTEIIFQTAPGSQLEALFNQCYQVYPSWTLAFKNFGDGWDLGLLRVTWGDLDTF